MGMRRSPCAIYTETHKGFRPRGGGPNGALTPRRPPGLVPAVLALALLAGGCATAGGAHPWAADATIAPGRPTVTRVVLHTATAPQTWAPLAVAALLQVDHLDARASAWSRDHAPVFGSSGGADRASDRLANAAAATCAVSILAVPSGTTPGAWTLNKAKGGVLDLAATLAALGVAGGLKVTTGRTRPDGTDHRSLPSGHATRASVLSTLAQRNARAALGNGTAARAAGVATFALAAACAWSRVEAGRHYPSDALVGFAIGQAAGAFVNDAFVTPAWPVSVRVSVVPREGIAIVASLK